MLKRFARLAMEWHALPRATVSLCCAGTAGNDPFYERAVRDFHHRATRRHPKLPLLRQYEHGFCMHRMDGDPHGYRRAIESSGRRNEKKASRLGYRFSRVDLQRYLDDANAIRRSVPVRQGKSMPSQFFEQPLTDVRNPPSRSSLHDYPYFGVLRDDRLYAYAGCLVAGELCAIESIYGHAEHLADGVVPMLLIGMAEWVAVQHPDVRYYTYGTYFGATESMQRFKRKFGFMPHRVRWVLGD